MTWPLMWVIGPPMFRKGLFYLCVLVGSLIMATTMHARELPGLVTLECSGAVRAGTESKEASGATDNTDKATIDHQGCHSASTFMAETDDPDSTFATPRNSYPMTQVATLTPRQSGPGLRPPIA